MLSQIDVDRVTELTREEVVQKTVSTRFGAKSFRLFNLLKSAKHLEQKQICEKAMVAQFKDTKILLNQLFHAKFITIQVREAPPAPVPVSILMSRVFLLNRKYPSK